MQSNPRTSVNLLVLLVNTSKFTSNISNFTSKTNQKEPQVKGGHGAWARFVLNRNGPYVEELLVDYWWDMEGL